MAAVQKDGKWGYVDNNGNEIIPFIYCVSKVNRVSNAGDFSEGLASVENDEGKWGYIDKTGKEVIPFIYGNAKGFSEGVAAISQDGRWGIIKNIYTIKVTVNEKYIKMEQLPIIENDRVLVPFRAIFEALNAEVEWNGETQTVTASKGDVVLSFQIGKQEMYINGKMVQLDVLPQIVNGRTLVPIRAISEGLGASVDWNNEMKTVMINI
jgi:hypothetical protein